jgi:hypothetical protein
MVSQVSVSSMEFSLEVRTTICMDSGVPGMTDTCFAGTTCEDESKRGIRNVTIRRMGVTLALLRHLLLQDFRHKPALLTRIDLKSPSVTEPRRDVILPFFLQLLENVMELGWEITRRLIL